MRSNAEAPNGGEAGGICTGEPLYLQARARIHEIIAERNLQPGQRLPSVREFSSAIGISRATVAKAISQMINEGFFISHPGKGVYLSENGAGKTERPLALVYCLVCASNVGQGPEDYVVHNAFWSQILSGARQALSDMGEPIPLRFSFMQDFLNEDASGRPRRRREGAGFLILGDPRPEQWQEVKQLSGPVVVVHGVSLLPSVAGVRVDCALGAEMLTDHLVGLGHRRIAYCGAVDPTRGIDHEKFKGFKRSIEKHKLAVDEDRYFQDCLAGLEEGYRVLPALLRLRERPTVVMLLNDQVAIGAIRAVRDAGLSVPADISVAGFDNIPMSSYVVPSLTTVSVRMEELGRLGVARLFAVHRNGERTSHILRPELIVRESTGPVNQP